jgi:hypothetical protein
VNGELALAATLAAIGGRWLREGARAPEPALSTSYSSFQYVGSFTADLPSNGLLRRTKAVTSPEEWLVALHSRGVTELSLITSLPHGDPLPAHIASAYSNSGSWGLLATGRGTPVVWAIDWQVGDRDAPASRIWSLSASGTQAGDYQAQHLGLEAARDRLRNALSGIRAFAERTEGLSEWASWFAKSESLLDDPAPTPPYHPDLLPPEASLERRQLAAAVVQGWVFGGTGSWNDNGCADPAAQLEYDRVGTNLHGALLAALPAAANGA